MSAGVVIALPTAAAMPVVQPRRRGPPSKAVVSLAWRRGEAARRRLDASFVRVAGSSQSSAADRALWSAFFAELILRIERLPERQQGAAAHTMLQAIRELEQQGGAA